jgi:hypothetical protein
MNESEDKSRHCTGNGTHLPDYKLKNDKEKHSFSVLFCLFVDGTVFAYIYT